MVFSNSFSIGFLTVVLGLAGCTIETVEVVDDRPISRPGDQFCPRITDPVCATRRGDRDTFSNACEARAEGYQILYGGACRAPRPRPVRACPLVVDPVCGENNGRLQTFANACEARRTGFDIIADGECRGGRAPRRTRDLRTSEVCSDNVRPVCAMRGAQERTFVNGCYARRSGWQVVDQGRC